MDYLYSKVKEAEFANNTPLRRAFRAHLNLVAAALQRIEWVDSGDSGEGYEEAAIRAVLAPGAEMEQLVREAKEVRRALYVAIEAAE